MAESGSRHYPVFLDLHARLVIVVGGGVSALKKVRNLRRYGADVTVITADPGAELLAAEADGELSLEHRPYQRGDLAGAALVICVEPDPEVRAAVRAEAESAGCLLNVQGAPEMCSFVVPAVVNRDPVQVAITTGGFAPGLARRLKAELAQSYGPEWGAYAKLIGESRAIAMELIDDPALRNEAFEAVGAHDLLDRLAAGERIVAVELMRPFVERARAQAEAAAQEVDDPSAEPARAPDDAPASGETGAGQ